LLMELEGGGLGELFWLVFELEPYELVLVLFVVSS